MTRWIARPRRLVRRDVLKQAAAAATAALFDAIKLAFPGGVPIAHAAGPETTKAILGFIALIDASALVIAKEKGIFARHGMPDVEVAKQASWGATRDNIVLGSERNGIDGAHILSPLPYLISSGKVTQNSVPTPMYLLARLNCDGQAISVSNEYRDLDVSTDASALKAAFGKKRAAGKEVKVAMTFAGGTHDLWIRYWLAAGGIDPDKEVSTIVVPPAQMVANMKVGNMDAFCVAEPWHEQLVNQNIGFTACTTDEIWPKHPEKAFALRAEWADRHPNAARALLMAVMEGQQWCDRMENKEELAAIVGRRQWFNVPTTDIIGRLKGDINYGRGRVEKGTRRHMKFWSDHASYPFKSHDLWFLTEDIRWGKFDASLDARALIDRVNREDLWRDAATALSLPAADIPASPSRGKETFFDGKVFDPDNPAAYLKSLSIKRVEA
jgi:nitrate/nitrite transport system substrate-binding protein